MGKLTIVAETSLFSSAVLAALAIFHIGFVASPTLEANCANNICKYIQYYCRCGGSCYVLQYSDCRYCTDKFAGNANPNPSGGRCDQANSTNENCAATATPQQRWLCNTTTDCSCVKAPNPNTSSVQANTGEKGKLVSGNRVKYVCPSQEKKS